MSENQKQEQEIEQINPILRRIQGVVHEHYEKRRLDSIYWQVINLLKIEHIIEDPYINYKNHFMSARIKDKEKPWGFPETHYWENQIGVSKNLEIYAPNVIQFYVRSYDVVLGNAAESALEHGGEENIAFEHPCKYLVFNLFTEVLKELFGDENVVQVTISHDKEEKYWLNLKDNIDHVHYAAVLGLKKKIPNLQPNELVLFPLNTSTFKDD